jgi:hypothetical protein
MGGLFTALALVANLVSVVMFVIVLVKLFQEEGAGKGILGIICGLYTLIWGWQNADRLNIKNIVLIWTIAIVAGIVLQVMGGSMSAAR